MHSEKYAPTAHQLLPCFGRLNIRFTFC
ncbi:hypothetical protein RHRU231_470086 [Rhodococcus ruber]|uniref:Uncharacterized protein n=1 Tax=Rhodococcus ruber TaxID=1830 RepID=A0A098BKL1_9NOCA|nr:hypothetical protein RHRU231_470086 [Rhodococcus ruber]